MKIFERGDRVSVRLSHAYEPGGAGAYPAEFVAYHAASREWAEVKLEEEHAGGVRTLHVPVEAIEEESSAA